MKLILIDDNGNESFNKEVKFVSCSFVDKITQVLSIIGRIATVMNNLKAI